MRSFNTTVTANSEILPGVALLEVRAPQLARAAQPGHYCLVRCCDPLAYDPLVRRPFFVTATEPEQDLCRFLVYRRGRGSNWLARQGAGMELEMLGPLGHAWSARPQANNLLLIGEGPWLASLLFLASQASAQEFSVTLIHCVAGAEEGYPAALLPPEIEYQVLAGNHTGEMLTLSLKTYLHWADHVCCSVSSRVLTLLTSMSPRWSEKYFAQVIPEHRVMCVNGTCQACRIETRHGARLICRDGPAFAWRELLSV